MAEPANVPKAPPIQRMVALVSRPRVRSWLVAAMILDLAYVTIAFGDAFDRRASVVGSIVRGMGSFGSCVRPRSTIRYFLRQTGGVKFFDTDIESADELARLSQSEPERVISVEWFSLRRWWGVWVPAIEPVENLLSIQCLDGRAQSTPSEAAEIRARYFAILYSGTDPGAEGISNPEIARLTRPDQSGLVVHWGAVIHNTLAAIAATSLAISIVASIQNRAGRRRAGLLARGLCAKCQYDIHSITIDAAGKRTCPECGSVWPADPPPKGEVSA